MNQRIFLIAIVFGLLLVGGHILVKNNSKIRSIQWLQPVVNAFGLEEHIDIPTSHNAVFCIFDPSGSGKSTYSVPQITVEFVRQLISTIEENGDGELWFYNLYRF